MVDFAYPWAFLVLLAGAPVLVRRGRHLAGVPVSGCWAVGASQGRVDGLDRIPTLLRIAAVLALAGAAGGPSWTGTAAGTESSGVAVMLVLDVSPSMGEEFSLGRSRLAAAREETLRFLEKRPGDAVGLVAFGREALVRVPPSLARDGLRVALDAAEPGELGEGTALGTALGLAADRLRSVDAPSRVVVLLTDGESNAGALDPATAARAAGALGQRLHVVDVSTHDDARAALAGVARAGGGLHRVAGDPSAMDRAYREIDALERAPFPGPGRAASVPVAGPLLWIALLLVTAERALRGSRWGTLP